MVFPKVLLPSSTPSLRIRRSFFKRIISADSFAISTAFSTEMPTSASRREGASFIPSPMYPTTWPLYRRAIMIRFFCAGVMREKIVTPSTTLDRVSTSICSTSAPLRVPFTGSPISSQVFFATRSLSPVRIFSSIPDRARSWIESRALSLGGSMKVISPARTMSFSSAGEK